MKNEIRYVHTNLVAKDWKRLAQFYIDVFGCIPAYPERDLSGNWIDKMTMISGVKIRGIHLKLPGYENGPTLEIFQYSKASGDNTHSINNYGFGHLAFHVSDVEDTVRKIISHGGGKYGELAETKIEGIGIIKAIYSTDPEGNIIEIQNWRKK
ncbi:MAG: VOC family protein [Bacteroidota bacterium]|nr:VOC family protein [Bacteroidota bacterium]